MEDRYLERQISEIVPPKLTCNAYHPKTKPLLTQKMKKKRLACGKNMFYERKLNETLQFSWMNPDLTDLDWTVCDIFEDVKKSFSFKFYVNFT